MDVFREGRSFNELIVLGWIIALNDKFGLFCVGLFTARLIFLLFLFFLESDDVNENAISEHGRKAEGSASLLVCIKPLY